MATQRLQLTPLVKYEKTWRSNISLDTYNFNLPSHRPNNLSNHPLVLHIQSSSKQQTCQTTARGAIDDSLLTLTVSYTHSHSLTGFKVPLAPDQHNGPRTRARRGCGLGDGRWSIPQCVTLAKPQVKQSEGLIRS